MSEPSIVFHVDLVQDVAVLRPLMLLAKTIPGRRIEVLTSPQFAKLDDNGRWQAELSALCAALDLPLRTYESEFDAVRHLQGKRGLLIAGSESDVRAHAFTHRLFQAAPRSFVKVTLQHGFECVGFLHNAAHDARVGTNVKFAADVLVGWFPSERLYAVTPAERSKLYVAGPPSLIEGLPARKTVGAGARPFEGMICENLHSVRLSSPVLRSSFLEQFADFAQRIAGAESLVHLRPHPAGRFTERHNVKLPPGTIVSSDPLYKLQLQDLRYAISAPSSILFDFVLAAVPVAIWVDPNGQIDIRNFQGLSTVASVDEWWNFAVDATLDPSWFLEAQSRFLARLCIPSNVRARYGRLLSASV